MKKIIELAEKYCDSAYSDDEALAQLELVLHERRVLEQTPITEDWLKEHGFMDEPRDRMLIYYKDSFAIEYDLTTWEWYWANSDVTLHSLADLLDACELCGITMD